MSDRRATYWTRWPDEDDGPLWVGSHYNERAGGMEMVGIEVWTEPPGEARQSLGPVAEVNADMLPVAPIPLKARDLTGIRLPTLIWWFVTALPENDALRSSVSPRKRGAGTQYRADHYARVAATWHYARGQGRRDTDKAVADQFNVSRSTASVWTRRAREMGLLDQG